MAKQKELTYRNLVKIGDEYIPLKDLPKEIREDFGNQVRKKPMEAIGCVVTEKTA